jgi:hypothetical protein
MTGAGKPAQHPSVHLLLRCGAVLGCQRVRLGKVNLPVRASNEQPVDHAALKVHMRIQRSSKALHKAHCAQPPPGAAAALSQPCLDHPQEDVQHRVGGTWADVRRIGTLEEFKRTVTAKPRHWS